MNCPMRPELEPLPLRMQKLPLDERGYPVPWFVAWADGKPEFRAMDPNKLIRAVKEKLCWVCGEKLGVNLCFVAGPMCGINRNTAEPPCHLDCGRYSARNCPFLNNPTAVRREDEVLNNQRLVEEAAGIALSRNPGVAMLWITRSYDVYDDGKGKPLFLMGAASNVEWYKLGRVATREEVLEAVENGLPALTAVAQTEKGGVELLNLYRKRFEQWIPK